VLQAAMAPFFFDADVIDEIGQALASGSALCIGGMAYDEQQQFAWEVGHALPGQVAMPYAVYAAGNVVRVFDPRLHREATQAGGEEAVMRERGARTQWASIMRPIVVIPGALLSTDVIPPFDDLAKLYLAPAPMVAFGGVLALCDAHQSDPGVLRELARLWLTPGRQGSGMLMLRSGERIEVPWRATALIMSDSIEVGDALGGAVEYVVDASSITGRAMQAFLTQRLPDAECFAEATISRLTGMLTSAELATRPAGAHAARYLRDRLSYDGAEFRAGDDVLHSAIQHASVATRRPSAQLRRVA
jgi:hypothetical protein